MYGNISVLDNPYKALGTYSNLTTVSNIIKIYDWNYELKKTINVNINIYEKSLWVLIKQVFLFLAFFAALGNHRWYWYCVPQYKSLD